MPEKLHILFYEYVEDVVERRAPHREGHLGLIKRWHDEGRIAMAGGVGDPPHAASSCCARRTSTRRRPPPRSSWPRTPTSRRVSSTSWRVEPFLNVTA